MAACELLGQVSEVYGNTASVILACFYIPSKALGALASPPQDLPLWELFILFYKASFQRDLELPGGLWLPAASQLCPLSGAKSDLH